MLPERMGIAAVEWDAMKRLVTALPLLGLLHFAAPAALSVQRDSTNATVIVAVGAAGNEEFGKLFAQWAELWRSAAERGNAHFVAIGLEAPAAEVPDRDRLAAVIAEHASAGDDSPLWIILIGHGTYDGRDAKFNLRGPDVSAAEFAEWLAPATRPLAVINCSAGSGPFIPALTHKNRVIITATKSGKEMNFARFGGYLARAIGDSSADIDKDGQTSLLEAFLTASRETNQFYQADQRLVTEHALLDDNGDGLGTREDFYVGVRPAKRARDGAPLDGHRAHQWRLIPSAEERIMPPELRRRRDEIELRVVQLRDQKDQFANEDEYYAALEPLLVDLARIYCRASESGDHSEPRP